MVAPVLAHVSPNNSARFLSDGSWARACVAKSQPCWAFAGGGACDSQDPQWSAWWDEEAVRLIRN